MERLILNLVTVLIKKMFKHEEKKCRFNDKRYSRTGVGITATNYLLLVTVDGNAEESAGFTNDEFGKFFQAMKCVSALNLDGGGSTTMWISGEQDNGVVSHPTGNKKYDHLGERKVANVIWVGKR